MRRLTPLCLCPLTLAAHMISISTGELSIEGRQGRYELRMPLYELEHLKSPERTLLENIRFSSSGVQARLLRGSCRDDAAEGTYACEAFYEFREPVEGLEVACGFYLVTVPNHVHLLRATSKDKSDRAVLDFTFRRAKLNFNPPSAFETALEQSLAGALRAAGGAAPVLMLAALVLAARSRRELVTLSAAFLAGEIASSLIVPATSWQPEPRFVEAAAALTIAYLAGEILLLPEAGRRWLVTGVLGVFHGLYFALLLESAGYGPGYVLAGVAASQLVLLALFAFAIPRLNRALARWRPVQVSACGLLAVGMVWFLLRIRG